NLVPTGNRLGRRPERYAMVTSCERGEPGITMCRSIDPLHAVFGYPRYPQCGACHARPGSTSPPDPRRDRKALQDKGLRAFWPTNMTAPLKSIEGSGDIAAAMAEIGHRARAAAKVLALAPSEQKNRALQLMAAAIRAQASPILAANAEDVAEARAAGVTGAFLDRLALDPARVEAVAAGVHVVRALKDPAGIVTESWTRPNGMRIERVRVPPRVIII